MTQSVICSGCGARLEVSEDYARKKIRCGQCGVIFELPEPANRGPGPSKPATRPARPPTPTSRPPDKKTDPLGAAPTSRTRVPEPASSPITSVKAPAPSPSPRLDEPSPDDLDDDDFAFVDGKDDRPYEKVEGGIRECPHCHATVNPEAKACSACGFLLAAKKTRRLNEPLERRWQTGWSFRRRLTTFLICQALVLTLFVSGLVGGMSPYSFPVPYVVFTGMTAFLFGTYNWVDLTRNKRGKLRMRQTWRICFFLRPTTTLRISDYEELAAGAEGHFGAINWIVVLFLMICGVFTGLVVGFFFGPKLLFLVLGGVVSCLFWWIFTWHKNTYFLSLCRDHGYPVVTLYRGWNRQQMEDMAETICTVAGLPLRR